MSIKYETVGVPLVGGLDTKSDQKSLPPTKLEVLENGDFTKGGSVRKRFGYDLLGTVEGGRSLLARHDELLVSTGESLKSYDPVTEAFADAGAFVPFSYTAEEAAYISAQQTVPDCASLNGVTVYAWEDSRGGVHCAAYNTESGYAYSADTTVASSNASKPRCVVAGNSILVCYADHALNDLKALIIQTSAVTSSLAGTPVTVVEDLNSTRHYDVISAGDIAYIAYVTDGTVATGNRVAKVSSAGVASSHTVVNSDVATAISLGYDATTSKVFVALYHSASTVFVAKHSASTLAQDSTATQAETDVTRVAVAPSGSGCTVWWEASAASTSNHTVELAGFLGATTTNRTLRHSGLGSSAFTAGNYTFVFLTHESRTGLQNQYYLYRDDGVCAGRALTGEGVGIYGSTNLPRVSTRSDGLLECALNFKRSLDVKLDSVPVATNAAFEHKGIKHVLIDTEHTPVGATLGNSVYISGAQLWAYDGVSAFEQGFHMFPDMLAADIVDGSAGAPAAGAYNYLVHYEWSDSHGERYRSAAIVRSHTNAGSKKMVLTIPTLAFTRKVSPRTNVSIVVYRTEVNKSQLYYRVSSSNPTTAGSDNGWVENNPAADAVTFTDNLADANILDEEFNYLSKGELPNRAPEGPTYVTSAQGRLWIAGGGQRPNNVRFSKLHFDGMPAEFAGEFEVTDGPGYGGSVTSVGYLNEDIVVYKERTAYALEGIGPDDTGKNGTYVVKPLSTHLGCLDPSSVLSYSDGILAKSANGFYLTDQAGVLHYIGAEAEAFNGQTCTAATLLPDTSQIILLMSSGSTLMYDHFYRQWGVYTNHTGLSAVTYGGTQYAYLDASGRVLQRNTSVYTDAGSSYKLKIRTAPLRLKDLLQGFWRARKLSVLGEYKSSHRLQVGVYYNRDEAPFETFIWEPDDVLELGAWGSDATWGSSEVWGGSFGGREYRFQHRFKRQKCETLRLEFEDLSSGEVPGASFELSEIALEVGLRDGLGRESTSRKV